MSKLGKSGKFPNNIERDLSNLLRLPLNPFYVKIPIRDPECRSKVTSMVLPVFLPHQMYHYLHVTCLNFQSGCFILVHISFCSHKPPKNKLAESHEPLHFDSGKWQGVSQTEGHRWVLEACKCSEPPRICKQNEFDWTLWWWLQIQRCWWETGCNSNEPDLARMQKILGFYSICFLERTHFFWSCT